MRRRVRSVVAFVSIAVSCRTPTPITPAPPVAPVVAIPKQQPTGQRETVELDRTADENGKVEVKLVDRGAAIAQLAVTELPEAELASLLAKLEPLPVTTAPAPAMRAPSAAPAPRGVVTPISLVGMQGTAIADTPPAPVPPAPVAPKVIVPLGKPELSPTGEQARASEVYVRFAEPMVPVAQLGETTTPPATISPSTPGTWRWIDTRVARFTAATRFPSATPFTVVVPAGTRALSGRTLDAMTSTSFQTPPITLQRLGMRMARPDAPIMLVFDQPFPPAIAKSIRIAHKTTQLAFDVITLDAAKAMWARDPRIKPDKLKLPEHYLIVQPKMPLPAGADLKITLAAGAGSLEGPRVSTRDVTLDYSTVKPFSLVGIRCDTVAALSGARCPATSFVDVQLTNAIPTWRPEHVLLDGQQADKRGGNYNIRVVAPATVGTKHTVELAPDLVDEYGQSFVGPRSASFTTTPPVYWSYLTAESGLYILDPRFEIPQWKVEAAAISALRIQLYRVEPKDYFAYQKYEDGDRKGTPPGKLIYDQQHPIGPRHAGIARVDLRPALTGGVGHVVGIATPIGVPAKQTAPKVSAWIQVTKLGVTARFDSERVQAWASQIDGAHFNLAVRGAQTTLLVDGHKDRPSAIADGDGHAVLEFPAPVEPKPKRDPNALLVATADNDSVFAAIDRHERSVRHNNAHWYVTDDRFTYKPKEPVYIKGWVRWSHDGVNPVLTLPGATDKVSWVLSDAKGVKLGAGTATLTPQGGFDLETTIPDTANLGTANFTFETRGDQRVWPIQIEEFRTPTFSVALDDDVTHRGATPLYAGEAIEMTANAKYYSGGGLAGARVHWRATIKSASYTPPGWDDYTFTPLSVDRGRWRGTRHSAMDTEVGSLSGASSSSIKVEVPAVPDNEPSLLQVEAEVTDLDRATIRESSRPILVHPSAYYVGIHQIDDAFELIVTDVDGALVPGVAIAATVEGRQGDRSYEEDDQQRIVDTQKCALTSAATPVVCRWKRKDDDISYSIVARVSDARGRVNTTRYWVPWWQRENRSPDLTVVADKAQYQPGDVAKLDITSSIVPATAVITLARQGVVSQKRIALTQKTTRYEVPIEPSFIRNVHVIVDRVSQRANSTLPVRAMTDIELRLDPDGARLGVTTRPLKATVGPGEDASFEVTIKHRGKPVANAEVALLAVDEAVLAVSDKRHADPLAPFLFGVEAATSPWTTLDQIVDAGDEVTKQPGFERRDLDASTGSGYGVGGGRGGMKGRSYAVPSVSIGSPGSRKTRSDFRATAVWSPKLLTDAAGRATVTVKMPDSLTRFRIVALATSKTYFFGKAESSIATQRPMNVRATAPRFLSQGDRFSLPVIVQNLDRQPRTIDVGVRTANLVAIGPMGKRVTVPPGQRAELRFELQTKTRGTATIQTVAQSGELFDASQIQLPVYVPATTEAFATYGIVDGDQPAFEQLAVPAAIVPDVGGVETDVYASQISSLLDAYWYLQEYPFECAEQRSSRMLANAALGDVLEAFAAPDRPSRADIDVQRARDVRELERDASNDGRWGYFRRTAPDTFVTQQVVAALIAAGHTSKFLDTAIANLAKTNLEHIAKLENTPDAALVSLASAELLTLGMTKQKPPIALALRLHKAAAKGAYPIDAKARVLAYLAKQPAAAAVRKELLAQLLSAAREDAATATVTTTYTDDERLLLVSNAKTTALVMDALIREVPEHALIPKLARGLLDGRKRGRWASTQENLAVLQAMRRYFDTYEKTAPEFTGKLWLGTAGYAEQPFAKRDARATVRAPWTQLAGTQMLTLAKTGPGRMYYRVGINYAPSKVDLPALDAGFVVKRSYAGAERSDVVKTDAGYKVKLGALVTITLEVSTTAKRSAVALVDSIPAGFEIVNARLATSGSSTQDTSAWDHVNLRDNRSEGFAMTFAEGHKRFVYTVRATTPGVFAAAPAKAEEMYAPETFGRSSGTTVTIE